jgi:hypothetical protein
VPVEVLGRSDGVSVGLDSLQPSLGGIAKTVCFVLEWSMEKELD